MFSERLWRGRSRNLTLLLLTVAVPPAATLVWLGWQLLQQDRALIAQRDLERRQAAAQTVVRSLEQSLVTAESLIFEGSVPSGMVRLLMSAPRVDAQPANRVLWLPGTPRARLAEERQFADAERLEFQGGGDRAVIIYEDAARSSTATVRAGALVRLARVHRQHRRWDAALDAYRHLTAIADVVIEGAPADLQARRAICNLLQQVDRGEDLSREAAALENDLLGGKWLLDRAAWELTIADLERWTGRPVSIPLDRKIFSSVADAVWNARLDGRARRVIVVDHTPVTLLSRAGSDRTALLAISPAILHAWLDASMPPGSVGDTRLSVIGPSDELLAGPVPTTGPAAVRAPTSDTGLPWTIVLNPGNDAFASGVLAGRQRLLSVGLAAILLLLGGGSYFLWRVMQRELAVARLQTDFVSAVSHEFRTPLTSLRHVAELLEENDEMPVERRRTFYEALGRNAERLNRLVESLLDFARMESDRKPYDMAPVDAAALVANVVAEFQKEVAARGLAIVVVVDSSTPMRVRADAVSFTNALWNLLDNAVKYSPGKLAVDVSVRRHPRGIAIAVRDEGLGVPARERKDIFGRFVRGETATRLGINGTGLGLAMVAHIVQAHRGTIELESEEGAGSTFTIVLPAGLPL